MQEKSSGSPNRVLVIVGEKLSQLNLSSGGAAGTSLLAIEKKKIVCENCFIDYLDIIFISVMSTNCL